MQKLALTFSLVLLFSVSLIKGSVPQWASLSWASLSFIFLAFYIALTQGQKKRNIAFIRSPAMMCLILFQTWALIQFLTPISRNTNASIDSFIFGLGLLCFLYLLYSSLQTKNSLKTIYFSLAILGMLQAVYGVGILFSGLNKLLWMDKIYYLDRPTGTFVNPNHYAAYLSLIFLLLVSSLAVRIKSQKNQYTSWSLYDQLVSPSSIIIIILLSSVLMTKSIGAIGSIVVVIIFSAIKIIRAQQLKKTLALGGVFSAFLLALILSIDFSIIEKELTGLSHTIERRAALSSSSFNLVSEHWIWGIGGGAFYSVFSKFRNLDTGNAYYNYAHNDYLQFWAEYGIIGMTLLALLIAFALKENIQVIRVSNNPLYRTFAYASVYGSIGLGVHSIVDFSLHIPAYTTLYICIISINVFTQLNEQNSPVKPHASSSLS